MFIDLHAHLDYKDIISRIDEIVENAIKNNIKIILASGIHPESNTIAIELSKKYEIIKPSLGLYPPDALQNEVGTKLDLDPDKIVAFIKKNKDKVAAIGEIGLDYKTGYDKALQKKVFRQFIECAIKLNKPIIIHSRKAEADALDILDEYKYNKTILHCFSGKYKLMLRARDAGYYFTIPTNVVRSEQFQHMIEHVNINKLFCETDTPFLSPFKDKQNEPANVVESYKKIAEIKGLGLDETSKLIYMNWQRLFQ